MRAFFPKKDDRNKHVAWGPVAATCLAMILYVNRPCLAEKPEISLDFSGYTGFQAGEIVRGQYKTDTLDHRWQERLLGGFNITATVNKKLKVFFNPECIITESVYDNTAATSYAADIESMHGYYFFYLNQMQGIYSFGDPENPYLQVGLGYFPFSYNPDIKGLGEYLFRATAYPGYIINDYASIYKRLAGLHVQANPVKNLQLDFLLTSEFQWPVGDFTPSLLANYAIGGEEKQPLVDIGAGISATRLISVDKNLTTPHYQENLSVINQDTIHLAAGDSLTAGDSIYYSFASVKLMARFSFDPKQLFGRPDIFGDEDLKIYGEGCILGIKDYPVFYDSITKRIPIMVGFNFPVFRILDVLSLEVEYYNNRYSNNYELTYFPRNKTPLPVVDVAGQPPKEPKPYPWYWSIDARKMITHGITLMAEVGRNHYFTQAKYPQYQDRREETPSHGDWMFIGRVQYSF